MNVRDGQEVTGLLLERGYRLTPDEESADVILYNTCSVREQAENRVWSNMGRLKGLKARRPEVVIGMMGCMAKAHRADAFRRMPHLD
ncbi:MAG: tRNA (N6-isopentenyl adenosine(37)-C2)-methylthiotransferase MiaB, partial [Candidatus Omnitrophica bacterium CG12_big_fil_rev_8_21_14_0_65_42_8]